MNKAIKKDNLKTLVAYQKVLWGKPRLTYLFLELTDRCNLHCKHCGSGCSNRNHTFLPTPVIEKVLKSVSKKYDPRNIMVCITGGEPMLHPDVFRIIKLAHSGGFQVGITTNGTLIDSKSAVKLKQSGLDTIAVSLDGIGDKHDSFRDVKGCFNRAIEGIDNLSECGIDAQVMTVIHKGNIFQLEEMYEYFNAMGIYSWRITNIDPIGRAASNESYLLSYDDLMSLYDFIRRKRHDPENRMEVTYGCSHFLGFDYENDIRDYYFQCGAGTLVASVMADGKIGACLDIERRPDLIQGDAYKDDFVEVWENRFDIFRLDRSEKSDMCHECNYKEVCLGDSAHTWNYDKSEPGYCLEKLRRNQK